MEKYILSIDQGTTSTRAVLIDKSGKIAFKAQREFSCLFPKPGWVEIEPDTIWISTIDVIRQLRVVSSCSFKDIAAIGITNQRETTIVWDKKTGKAVYNAIVWQSKQTKELCDEREQYMDLIQQKTGLRRNPYFSASKIRFILDHIPNGQERAERGELRFGTVDSWLIYKRTGDCCHYTDVTNASRTRLFNIHTRKWDEELLKIWNIPASRLPEVKDNRSDFGPARFFDKDTHILGVAGDQQAALFGQCCFNKGDLKNTYGTGCFRLRNIGNKPIISKQGLLTTVAWSENGKPVYAFEGSVLRGGAIVQWLRDQRQFFRDSKESSVLAEKVEDTAGVYVVPAFVGLGTPYWDDEARGAVFGLTRGANQYHFIRATLDSIAYQSKDVIEARKRESNIELIGLKVDGGASSNPVLMQFQADILQCDVLLPECVETTALGAGYRAGLYQGFFESKDVIKQNHEISKIYHPHRKKEEREKLYSGWLMAVESTRKFKPKC